MCAREADPKGAQAALLGIYTLTPTHCGTGKAMDAVDLPIAREGHTRHPVLPSSSIKGALRAAGERALNTSNGKDPRIADWFGPEIKKPGEGGTEQDMAAGSVIFTDARLLAFPVRALHTAFAWVTCPLVLERFYRDLVAFGAASLWPKNEHLHPTAAAWKHDEKRIQVASRQAALVLEDLAFKEDEQVANDKGIAALATTLSKLVGGADEVLTRRLARDLVVVADDDFADLVTRTMPVQARIRLNDNKTTTGDGGNLWYEETLPPDALFSAFLLAREGGKRTAETLETWLDAYGRASAQRIFRRPVQIGGNETVGQGFCTWHVAQEVSGGR